MDNILHKEMKEHVLQQLKYDLNSTNSDSDTAHDDDDDNGQIKEKLIKVEPDMNIHNFDITKTSNSLVSDLILPEAVLADPPKQGKKRERSKKELEEEEREKMQ